MFEPGGGARFVATSIVALASWSLIGSGAAWCDGAPSTAEGSVSRARIGRAREADGVRRALHGASERLARPGCQRIFAEFRDASGRTLGENLDAMDQTGESYLGWILFIDGFGEPACRARRAFAVTEAGSRVVRICTEPFLTTQRDDPTRVEASIIHEMLHSLGLGENPPSSDEITSSVIARCFPDLAGNPGKHQESRPAMRLLHH